MGMHQPRRRRADPQGAVAVSREALSSRRWNRGWEWVQRLGTAVPEPDDTAVAHRHEQPVLILGQTLETIGFPRQGKERRLWRPSPQSIEDAHPQRPASVLKHASRPGAGSAIPAEATRPLILDP